MTDTAASFPPDRIARTQFRLRWLVLLASMALLSAQAADTPLATALLGFGLTALFVALIGAGVRLVARRMSRGTLDVVTDFLRHDPAICVITDDEGLILAANDAGRSRIDQSNDTTLGSALRYVIADPGAILLRVRRNAP